MKKVLLSTAAVALAFAAMPAHAGIDLSVSGYFKGYAAFVDQDEGTSNVNGVDFLRDTEIHVGGETTLDNGLTVGFHTEFDTDGADSSVGVDESYLYMSGTWGRVNIGEEDGASYLLQVAAPSADSNVDGLRTYIQPVNLSVLGVTGAAGAAGGELEYAQDPTGKDTKITYLTPVIGGFQGGVSYTPDSGAASDTGGVGLEDDTTDVNETYEIAARYEGELDAVGFTLGAGYSNGDDATPTATSDDRQVWNVGLDLDFGPIGLGAIYKEDNAGSDGDEEETIVVGVDYVTGPFKLGATYSNFDNLGGVADLEAERYVGGVTYTYGPGMTVRGSVHFVDYEAGDATDGDATSFLIGTQVKF